MSKIIYRVACLAAIALFISNIAAAQKKKHADTDAGNNYSLPWKPIDSADILWQKRVWREINIYEENNVSLTADPTMPQENVFANILLKGINTGAFKAYANDDTAFTTPLTVSQVAALVACDQGSLSHMTRVYLDLFKHMNDTVRFYVLTDADEKKLDTMNMGPCVYPRQIEWYKIKEDWMFDRSAGQMLVHIVAIVPVDGQKKCLFWVKYPDIRAYMAQYKVYKNKKELDMNWDEYFESRQFSSKITYVADGMNGEVIEDKQKHKRKKPENMNFDKDIERWGH